MITSENGKTYGIADCLVVEQGPNYALAKRIQQWRATLARHQGQRVVLILHHLPQLIRSQRIRSLKLLLMAQNF